MANYMNNKSSFLFVTNDEFDANFSRKPFLNWIFKIKGIKGDIIYPKSKPRIQKNTHFENNEYFFRERGISFFNLLKLRQTVNKNNYDLVVARGIGNIILWSFTFFIVKKKPKTIFFLTGLGRVFNNSVPNFIKQLYKIILKILQNLLSADIIVQNGDDAIELKLNKEFIINGSGYSQNLKWKKKELKKINIITASRLTKSKGIDEIIRFAEYIANSNNLNFNYTILGDYNNLADSYKKKIIQLNNYSNIHFKGFHNSVEELLVNSHFAFFPSNYREGSPRFLIQSISCGLIPITLDGPGCKSFLKFGIFYTNPEITMLKIDEIVSQDEFHNMSFENYNYFNEIFSSKIVYEKYFNIINKKINGKL